MTTIIGRITNAQNRPLLNVSERLRSSNEMYRRMLDAAAEKHRSATIAQVVSFDPERQTITAQPLIREKVIDRATGSVQWLQLPQLLDVPVFFPQAGNFVLTMPVAAGDEVLLIFGDSCIDSWFTSGGIQNPNTRRRHDLSDAIAIAGINSQPHTIGDISTDAAELRSKDGTVKVKLKTDEINLSVNETTLVVKDSQVDINATTINLNGVVKHNNKDITHHVHSVSTAPGTTGPMTEIP